jgi:hypothetical protein
LYLGPRDNLIAVDAARGRLTIPMERNPTTHDNFGFPFTYIPEAKEHAQFDRPESGDGPLTISSPQKPWTAAPSKTAEPKDNIIAEWTFSGSTADSSNGFPGMFLFQFPILT